MKIAIEWFRVKNEPQVWGDFCLAKSFCVLVFTHVTARKNGGSGIDSVDLRGSLSSLFCQKCGHWFLSKKKKMWTLVGLLLFCIIFLLILKSTLVFFFPVYLAKLRIACCLVPRMFAPDFVVIMR